MLEPNTVEFKLEKNETLINMIKEGKSLDEIHKIFMEENDLSIAVESFNEKIKNELGFWYDKEDKKWISHNSHIEKDSTTESENISRENTTNEGFEKGQQRNDQINFFADQPQEGDTQQSGKKAKKSRSSTKKSNQDFPLLSTVDLTDLINKINMIYEYSHDAYKEVLELDTKLSNLNKKVTQIQKSNIHRKVSQYPHEFAKIYTSKSVKTSLNLNENVKNRILELMKERFDEEDKSSKKGKKDKESKCNDSKLINAALLLALYYVDQEQNESDI